MHKTLTASRKRFQRWVADIRKRRKDEADPSGDNPKGRHRSARELLWRFLGLLRQERAPLLLALATLTVATLLKLIPPAATKVMIDNVLGAADGVVAATDGARGGITLGGAWSWLLPAELSRIALLAWLAGTVLVVSLIEAGLHLWGRWYATQVTKRVQTGMRKRAFEHAVRLPLHRIYQLKSGGVASLLREDAGSVAELVFGLLYNPWRAIVQLIGSMLVLAFVDWRLLLGSLVIVPSVFITHRTWINRIRPLYRDVRRQRQDIDAQATETFGGMRVVRAFGRAQSEVGRFTKGNHFLARQELYAWWWSRGVEVVWSILIPLASTALLWYGGTRVLSGALSLGELMMFLVYLTMLLGPLATLAESATQLQSSLAGLDRVLDVLDEPREMPVVAGAVRIEPALVAGGITLREVGFTYPGSSTPVLEGVNLRVEPGQMVALVGRSGAGKTTLCNLVARFYDPTTGSVELDGLDLRQIDVQSYRGLLGIVEQEIFLFDGSVAENIAYAVRHATQDQVERAAQIANADEFIRELEKGYETMIGERGVRLSGGQRQRLAIARAVLANPRILILDEATSSLDTHSERLIQRSLAELLKNRTSFVIAHRLSTIRHADRIVVLEGGRLCETGTHEELMADSGRYRQMVLSQLGDPGELVAQASL